uniref:Dynactin subunit 2 n=1 Tax=Globisporangium ultimum (strain ATCC 200006 / CBS 805.95 / DAOM BR144) TaxID=431595 RepID=K3X0S5_GLOUD
MGKVYKPTPRLSKQTEYESTGGLPSTSASLATLSLSSQQSKKQELESPLTRFTRLTMEIKELEADLTLLAKNADVKKAKLLVDAAQEAEYEEVMEGLATLQSNLAAIEQNAAFQPFLHHGPKQINAIHGDNALALQKELTSKFFKQIEALKAQQQGKTSVASSAGGETAAPIVYEIYSNGELNAIDKDAKTRTLALESRIATLEKAIGNFHVKELRTDGLSGLSTSGADLMSVVAQLEKRVNLLNEKNLDSIKTRTTALIHEFTLLNKLKESPSVQGALNSHADREKIQQIYDKLKSIDDVSGAVPALVDRLVTLKSIHDESLNMTARVKKVEQANETLSGLLETDTALLENIEKSLAENVKIFQSNIQTLDERMATLLQSK